MNRIIALIAIMISISVNAYIGNSCCVPQARDPIICYDASVEYSANSFMFTRPAMQHLARDFSVWHNVIYKQNSCRSSDPALQAIAFFQESLDHEQSAYYFLINRKKELLVCGDASFCASFRDVRSEWLGIDTNNFSGTMSIAPTQRQYGCALYGFIPISYCTTKEFFQHWWMQVSAPIVCVENDINITQGTIINPGISPVKDILSAFNQPDWRYARMGEKRKRVGLAELKILFGITYVAHDEMECGIYCGFTIPTSGRQKACEIFYPFVGNNGHGGFIGGIQLQMPLWCDAYESVFSWFLNLEGIYLFRNTQCRTFDLRYKQWSRYMLYNRNDGLKQRNIPGVNVLTREVFANPYVMANFLTGLRYRGSFIEAEIGYGIWGHGNEHLRLTEPFPSVYGIAGPIDPINPDLVTTASTSTIAQQGPIDKDAVGNPLFVAVKASDLDLFSAGMRSAINHQFHVSCAYHYCTQQSNERFVGVGCYYEFPQRNSALELWGCWVKAGCSWQ